MPKRFKFYALVEHMFNPQTNEEYVSQWPPCLHPRIGAGETKPALRHTETATTEHVTAKDESEQAVPP